MLYIQLNTRAKVATGQTLRIRDAASILGKGDIGDIPLPIPEKCGIWKLTALDVAKAVQSRNPSAQITLLGADTCYVHRVRDSKADWSRPLRTAAAFTILCLGGALGLCWFHADVDMPKAQFAVYQALTGKDVQDERFITIPYVIGVALGVAVFYALPSKTATTPLEVKLTEYQSDMEATEGRDLEDGHG